MSSKNSSVQNTTAQPENCTLTILIKAVLHTKITKPKFETIFCTGSIFWNFRQAAATKNLAFQYYDIQNLIYLPTQQLVRIFNAVV